MNALDLLALDVVKAAHDLIGWELVVRAEGAVTSGVIVETEAYRAANDPASHAYRGHSARNEPMWQEAGTIYVYLSYGLHTLLNLVTGPAGQAEAVLIRAIEPLTGIELMERRRGMALSKHLTNGPAKLTQAMGIGLSLSGAVLGTELILLPPREIIADITTTTRIGISRGQDLPWRFYATASPYVSRR